MQTSNFEFLRPENEVLANLGSLAESVLYIDPGSALTRLRAFAEEATKSIYKEERLPRSPSATFSELINNGTFKSCVSTSLLYQINYLRFQGNETAHGAEGKLRDAQVALGAAHQLAMYMGIKHYGKRKETIPELVELKDPTETLKQLKKTASAYKAELKKQEEANQALINELERKRTKLSETLSPPAKPDAEKRKQQSEQVGNSLQWSEAKTRALLIDTMLTACGWDLSNSEQVGIEVEVEFPDNISGTGYADYVLWGENGQPLAVIEAKRSGETNLQAGREQARLYADALENMGYERPIIFYTNGYETFIWDDKQYNSYRQVYGFYSEDSLEYLIYQRQYRVPQLERHNPELSIADRPYQIEAIKTVAKHFQTQHRKALIIQATGTGKTRVAIALSELLLRTGWAKRILFLCDRKELRKQADEAFAEHLGTEPRCVIGSSNHVDQNAHIYVSTYPGMMNRFAQLDVGFFDLIIADESHRSIYNKYRDLFDYFDALQIGLTATPVKFISRNTFGMFDCKDKDPTFEFSLNDALTNEPPYLADFRAKDLTTDFLRDGIHYNDLNDEQRQQLEEDLGEEQAKRTTIAGKDIGRKIFSDTTDKIILENLIKNGLQDATGSLVGKTIIFAQRQDHAEQLEKMFCELYPQYGSKVCKVIHNKVPKVDSLLKEFKQADNDFRIAISVDMMDTGIDVPEVVNLVFAKPVRSWVKFWQMIGRGTRLCPNLFGPGKHKTEFLIFDHYDNFTYFNEEYKEPGDVSSKSLLQSSFEARLELILAALKANHAEGFDTALALIKADINDLPEDSIAVKRELRTVKTLQESDLLQKMDASTQHKLSTLIAPLMGSRVLSDKHAIQFDKLIATIQRCLIQKASCFTEGQNQLLTQLDKLAVNIQAVRQKDKLINEVRTAEFWDGATVGSLEHVRVELRGIMKYQQSGNSEPGFGTPSTRTADDGIREQDSKVVLAGANEAMLYRRRLKAILDQMVAENVTLQKIHNGEPISELDLNTLTSTILTANPGVDLNVLNEFYGRTAEQLHITIRELIGLKPEMVEAHFQQFLHAHPTLTAKQTQFMNLLKNYIAQYGNIEIDKLYEAPFINISHDGIDGVFSEDDADDLMGVLKPFFKVSKPTNNPSYSQ